TGEETNPGFNNIIDYMSRVRHADQKAFIPAFDVQSLLPKDLGRFYRYNGSLTTPPCYQSVFWTVFHERVQISKAQLLKMETILYSSKAQEADRMLLQDNFRMTQPLNHRVVFASFSAGCKEKSTIKTAEQCYYSNKCIIYLHINCCMICIFSELYV
ncbi:hypothetical protein AMECASPLE_003657, partial [Ameca splendens]